MFRRVLPFFVYIITFIILSYDKLYQFTIHRELTYPTLVDPSFLNPNPTYAANGLFAITIIVVLSRLILTIVKRLANYNEYTKREIIVPAGIVGFLCASGTMIYVNYINSGIANVNILDYLMAINLFNVLIFGTVIGIISAVISFIAELTYTGIRPYLEG